MRLNPLRRFSVRASLSCRTVDQYAVRYFFAGVSAELEAQIRQHLAACPHCRRKLQLFERVWHWDGTRRGKQPEDGLSIPDEAATMSDLFAG
jgi:hypothetical protein